MKIGLIGAENSHAEHFCKAVNKEKNFPGFSIAWLYGAGGPTDLQECRGIKVPEKYLFSTNNIFYRTSRFNRPVKFWRAGGFELKDLKPEK